MELDEKKARGEWPFPPMVERIRERVWAVCPYERGEVTLRCVNFYEAELYAGGLLRRGFQNVWVYPEDEAKAIAAYVEGGQ